MKILFIHPNQPSQFKRPAIELASDSSNEVVFLSRKNLDIQLPNVRVVGFHESDAETVKADKFSAKVVAGSLRATAVASVCLVLKQQGFTPDIIVAHSGWGDGLYLKTVYPDVPQLHYMEFFFQPIGSDLNFEPGSSTGPNILAARSMDNTIHMANFFNADWCVSPTYWQRSVHPVEMQSKISVLHEGVNTKLCAPKQWDSYVLPNGKVLNPLTDEIVTHIQRQFDKYRGFETVIRAVEEIQRRRPNAQILIVGKDGESYTQNKPGYYKDIIYKADFDRSRVHFLGHLPFQEYIKVLQVSSANIYLTYPFVLSWSFIEAMSVGCPMICSNTPPVAEVAKHEENCLMFDFFNASELADSVDRVLDDRSFGKKLGITAREKVVQQYDRGHLSAMMIELIKDIGAGKGPPAAAKKIADWNNQLGRDDESWQRNIPLYPYSKA
ncbi:MAG: glycosyltransferase involved in cell wall biosynthesis [Porticoccus sp.]|jgi:glycosyltransferase involved in cell wall biosynthesis